MFWIWSEFILFHWNKKLFLEKEKYIKKNLFLEISKKKKKGRSIILDDFTC